MITLVIIGVVAALTLPTLMTKYQQHVFENKFKKSLYTISQIVARTRNDLGVSRLGEYCAAYDKNKTGGYYNAVECVKTIAPNIINVRTKPKVSGQLVYNTERTNEIFKTYNNKNNITKYDAAINTIFYVNQLSDGSFLGFYINNGCLFFGVDINGRKKPNRLGYDVFIFSLNNKNDAVSGFLNTTPKNDISDNETNSYTTYQLTYGVHCNLNSTRESNGLGCSYYALRNKCPYDDTKTYWECLK